MNDTATDTDTRSAQLVMLDQQLALSAYLNALLRPAPVEIAPEIPVAARPEVAQITRQEIVAIEDVAVTVSEIAAPEIQPGPVAVPARAGVPDWAQGEFQCLLFRVAGLTLALPLARLSGVLPWDAEAVTPMPNHRPWFLGLREYLGRQVKLIDVAKVVLPPGRAAGTESAPGKVILIDDGRWGLAVSEVAEVITLSTDAVKWRRRESAGAGSRPWLAGTVIDRMCALIDSDVFAGMLGGDGPPA